MVALSRPRPVVPELPVLESVSDPTHRMIGLNHSVPRTV